MEILDRIDWASVNWLYVAVLSALVFFSTLIGALLSFKRAFRTAVLSALLFAVGFVFWTYYLHGLPMPTSVTEKAPDTLRPNERRHNHEEEPPWPFLHFDIFQFTFRFNARTNGIPSCTLFAVRMSA